jgi:predicted RNase H-like nuclease
MLAGVVPTRAGWLVAGTRLRGITLTLVDPFVMPTLREVLDVRPAYDVIALAAPIGLLEDFVTGGRGCDREARRLLGWRRGAGVAPAPPRPVLDGENRVTPSHGEAALASRRLSAASRHRLRWIREVDEEIQPYWQRTVFGVHPELSYLQLNGDRPLSYSKHTAAGREERRALLEARLHDVGQVLDFDIDAKPWQLLDAVACAWTARRIIARAVDRLPSEPEWDTTGLRMELVR